MKHLIVSLTSVSAQGSPLRLSKLGQVAKTIFTSAIFWWVIGTGFVTAFVIRKQNEESFPLSSFEQRYILIAMICAIIGILFLQKKSDAKYRKNHPAGDEPRWLKEDGCAKF